MLLCTCVPDAASVHEGSQTADISLHIILNINNTCQKLL